MKKVFILLIFLSLVVLWSNCEKNLTGPKLDNNPNQASEVPMESLLSAIEVNSFVLFENFNAWIVAIWMQQMSGTAMTFMNYGRFEIPEDVFETEWRRAYCGAGLVDIKNLRTAAVSDGNRKMEGIAKVLEAFFMGNTASLYGDIPYSEAIIAETPKLDKMSDVFSALHTLLDQAIADLSSGVGFVTPDADHYYGADADKWIALAHSLKARFYLEWAEVNSANYALALAEAQQGIASSADNFKAKHSEVAGEENCWYQLDAGARSGNVRAGKFLVELLKTRNDPRLELYYNKDSEGNYNGSDPGDGNSSVGFLCSETFGSKSWASEFVSWEEMQFIIAESQYAAGDEASALSTLDGVLAGIEAKFGITGLPRYSGTGLTGQQVLEAIMMEKYIAMFLNFVVWSDWKRTGYPHFTYTYENRPIPRRFLYPLEERNANPNIPSPSEVTIYTHNENDPN